jgi:hypothetical protein
VAFFISSARWARTLGLMTNKTAIYLKWGVAAACVLLAVGTLPSIWLLSEALIDGAVSTADREHFEWKLAVYLVEVSALLVVALFAARSAKRKRQVTAHSVAAE